MIKPIQKVLVANRGEIAVRIFKTLHKMGISSVAIYADGDDDAAHVHMAKESFRLEGKDISDTYLNIPQIISLAEKAGADAIHPGYGFLSESDAFSSAVRRAGLIFIGPGDEAIRLMGNKVEARAVVGSIGVPVIQGVTGTADELLLRADQIGFPLLVKAAAGGGGKGMRIVRETSQLHDILETTQREALNYFGNGEVYLERYLEHPRHIEVQLIADTFGNVVSLFERECSIQRRYQKIIEEAPSIAVDDSLRSSLMEASVHIARHIGYENAGTIEYLVSQGQFWFLEMNTRIQVEHPVTELITGVDLVKEQIRVASGLALSFKQDDLQIHGHAIEARVYAEDPGKHFLPSPGRVVFYQEPKIADIRIDAALQGPGNIKSDYDPMISKVIAFARSREAAREKLIASLTDYVIHGIKTNIPFLVDLLNTEAFIEGNVDTEYCNRFVEQQTQRADKHAAFHEVVAAAFLFVGSRCLIHNACEPHEMRCNEPGHVPGTTNPWTEIGYWRVNMTPTLLINDTSYPIQVLHKGNGTVVLKGERQIRHFKLLSIANNVLTIKSDDQVFIVFFSFDPDGHIWIQLLGNVFVTQFALQLNEQLVNQESHQAGIAGIGTIKAPMHGKIVKVYVNEQDIVNKGDALLVIESMKIENKMLAPGKARVEAVMVKADDRVSGDTPLILLSDNI